MAAPKPITLTSGANPNPSVDPQPYVVVGGIAGTVTPQAAPTVNATPTDAAEVAGDLQDLVNALQAAGVLS